MSKAYLGAFVAIAIAAVGAVDYINQAKAAGSKPGQFGVGDYAGTISGRFIDQQASLSAKRTRNDLLSQPTKIFMPEAPEGWTRSDWTEAAAAQLGKVYDLSDDPNAPEELKQDPTMKALATIGKAVGDERNAAQVYVYEKPGAIVAMRISKVAPSAGIGPQGFATQMVANNIEAMSGKDGYAVVKGVTDRLEHGLFGMQDQERDYRVITASLRDEIKISLRAKAEDADIIALLNGIDYDRMNQMMKIPLEGIGSGAPELSSEDSLALASANVAKDAADQRARAAEQERRLQLASLDLLLRHGQMTQEQYDTAKAKLETARSEVGFIAGIAAGSEAPAARELQSATTDAASRMESPASGAGGFMAVLGGFLGGWAPADAPIEPATEAKPKIKVNALGSGACESTGLGKRCKIGE